MRSSNWRWIVILRIRWRVQVFLPFLKRLISNDFVLLYLVQHIQCKRFVLTNVIWITDIINITGIRPEFVLRLNDLPQDLGLLFVNQDLLSVIWLSQFQLSSVRVTGWKFVETVYVLLKLLRVVWEDTFDDIFAEISLLYDSEDDIVDLLLGKRALYDNLEARLLGLNLHLLINQSWKGDQHRALVDVVDDLVGRWGLYWRPWGILEAPVRAILVVWLEKLHLVAVKALYLLTSIKTVHNRHVQIQENEVKPMLFVVLNELESF